MREKIDKTWQKGRGKAQKHRSLILYGIIGLSGVALDIAIFAVLVNLLHINPVIATIVSTSCGIINNFILNAVYNFKKRDHLLRRFAFFYGVGAAGIAASALVLLIFSDILGANPNVVKLLSIPPIVLGQYWLNKRISFGDGQRQLTWQAVSQLLTRHRYLLLINGLFLVLSMTLVMLTPFRAEKHGAPDEHQHYGKNVDFMIHEKRLPVAGRDDIDALSRCRENQYGQVPCTYSYQFSPQFNYIVSAVTTKLGGAVGLGGFTGARLASVLWGLVFINSLYAMGRLFLRRNQALAFMFMIGFIPQVIFISSYVNQDIHSLAIASVVVYSSVGYLYLGRQKLRWLMYASFGLLLVAKYNYFITALVPLVLLARLWWQDRSQTKMVVKQLAWMAGAAVLLSGFWYARNLILYHDPLGQQYILDQMAKYHPLGHGWSLFDIKSYMLLWQFDFFDTLFKSFFATFGYMVIYLDAVYYAIVKLVLVAGTGVILYFGTRKHRRLLLLVLGFVLIALFQVIANSFIYDFQPQGRYMFVVLPVVAAALAVILCDFDKLRPWLARTILFTGVSVTAWLVWQSIITIGVTYGSVQ